MRAQLAKLSVEVGTERVIVDRNRITGGGVTAGIDFALTITSILYGEETAKIVQLLLEYNPAPPFDVGSPQKAGPELVNKAVLFMQGDIKFRTRTISKTLLSYCMGLAPYLNRHNQIRHFLA
jgi:cyclohexyl-isocyanide hydratase